MKGMVLSLTVAISHGLLPNLSKFFEVWKAESGFFEAVLHLYTSKNFISTQAKSEILWCRHCIEPSCRDSESLQPIPIPAKTLQQLSFLVYASNSCCPLWESFKAPRGIFSSQIDISCPIIWCPVLNNSWFDHPLWDHIILNGLPAILHMIQESEAIAGYWRYCWSSGRNSKDRQGRAQCHCWFTWGDAWTVKHCKEIFYINVYWSYDIFINYQIFMKFCSYYIVYILLHKCSSSAFDWKCITESTMSIRLCKKHTSSPWWLHYGKSNASTLVGAEPRTKWWSITISWSIYKEMSMCIAKDREEWS